MKILKAEKMIDKDGNSEIIQVDDNGVIRCVPICEDNKDYQQLMQEEKEGKIEIKDRDFALQTLDELI